MSYTTVKDKSFAAVADTTVGSGADSTTGVGDGFKDVVGNLWQVVGGVAANGRVNTPPGNTDLPCSPLVYATTAYRNGKAIVFPTSYGGGDTTAGPVARVSGDAAHLYGYGTFLYGSRALLFLTKRVNGVTQTRLAAGVSVPVTVPTGYGLGLTLSDTSGTATLLIVEIFDPADLTTPIWSYSVSDTSSPIQSDGLWGVDAFNGGQVSRIVLAQESAGPLAAGTASTVAAYKTVLKASTTAATAGEGGTTYQWHGSTTSGFTPGVGTAIAGQTSTSLRWGGRTAGTTYYVKCVATDGTSTVTTNQLSITTVAASAYVIAFAGNSITDYGTAPQSAVAAINAAGKVAVYAGKVALGGTSTGQWAADYSGLLTALVALVVDAGADSVSIELGTNDAADGLAVAATAYAANLSSIAASLLAGCPTLQRVAFNAPPYAVPGSAGGQFGAASDARLQAYATAIAGLANGTTILAGDTAAYAYFAAHTDQLVDGIHPTTPTGYAAIGGLWGAAFVAAVTPVLTTLTVTAPSIAAGGTGTATASGLDQFGASIATGTVTWSGSTGLTINASTGVYTAATAGSYTITGASGGVSGEATLVVTAVPSGGGLTTQEHDWLAALAQGVNVTKIAGYTTAVDTGGGGIVSFFSNAFVMPAGGEVSANVTGIGGEPVRTDYDGRLFVNVDRIGGLEPTTWFADEAPIVSVPGAVGSVTGSVGGSVGSVASGVTVGGFATGVQAALATAIQAGIIDETDGQQVLAAIVSKINATDVDLAGLSTTSIAQAVAAFPLASANVVGSLGKRIADNLDATISSRGTSTYAGGDTAGTGTLLGRLTSTRAGLLDNLDAAVSSRLPTTGYTAPNNAAIATAATNAAAAVSATDAATLAIVELTDAVNGLPGGGGGGGASAAEVWGYEDRLLTAYPSQVPSSVPIPGLGLYAAGAGVQAAARSGVAIEGQSIALLCRPLRVSGAYFTIATTASVTTLVVDEQATTPPPPAISHVPAEVIRNAPAIDGRWTEDGIGFNVDVPVAGSRLPRAGTSYRVTLRLTDTAGQSSVVRWLVQT